MSPEQLRKYKGHLPRMARIIRQDQKFVNKIFHITVDESHYLVAAGIPKNGLLAFRPSYGSLDEFRLLLPSKTSFQALSATLNPFVKSLVKKKLSLCSNFLDLKMSVNRLNITYATYRLVGGTSNFHNLDFLVPLGYDKPFEKKFLVFVDKKANTWDMARYMTLRFATAMQELGIARHYHSGMSVKYLEQTPYNSFASRNGTCRILFATKGASTVCKLFIFRL
jgi:hypothetical protein